MKRFQRSQRDVGGAAKPGALFSAFTVVFLLGGCSADVGRFDFPTFNLNGDKTTSALPTPSEPMMSGGSSLSQPADRPSGSYGGGAYIPPRAGASDRGVDMAALPDASPQPAPSYDTRPIPGAAAPYQPPRAGYAPSPRPMAEPVRDAAPVASGGSIEVQRGDTLYGLARRNGVTVKDLMAANGLTDANIRPGQRLRMPGGDAPAVAEASVAPARLAARAPVVADAAPTASNSDWGGSYTVQSGDSLYRIARTHNVRVAELQSANGITNPRQLKPGVVLRVPGGASTTPRFAEAPRAAESQAPRVIQSTTQPTVINGAGERQVAALDTGRMSDTTPAPAAPRASNDAKAVKTVAVPPAQIGAGKLRWPSKGKIISGFGQRPDGTHNDGIDIAVPLGTDVHAAEEGEVAYAGSELKGYGNLVLVRHDNGWVTAYAHADQLLVKRGDKVRRGDVIAKAGKTGQVDQPQLHFELRQGSKPVDPLPYLDRL